MKSVLENTTIGLVSVFLLLASAPVASAGVDADVACQGLKSATAGKYALCRLGAVGKGVKKGEAPDYGACDAKLTEKWTKHDDKGGADCPYGNGAQGAVAAEVTTATDTIAGLVAGSVDPDFKCEVGKLKAAARYIVCRQGTINKALKKGIGPGFNKCDNNLAGKWSAIEAKHAATCPTVGDVAAIQTEGETHTDAVQVLLVP